MTWWIFSEQREKISCRKFVLDDNLVSQYGELLCYNAMVFVRDLDKLKCKQALKMQRVKNCIFI